MGVHASMMYVDLLSNPALALDGLHDAQSHFQGMGAHTRVISQPYSPALQDAAMITGLAHMPMKPDDWVIVADMDEFFTYSNSSSVQAAARAMEAEGASFALGTASHQSLNTVSISLACRQSTAQVVAIVHDSTTHV